MGSTRPVGRGGAKGAFALLPPTDARGPLFY